MKIIVAGSRHINDFHEVYQAIRGSSFYPVTEIVSGGASGVDAQGEALGKFYGRKVTVFPADWNKHGRAAGPIRNRQMAEYADALVAVWDGKSRGTQNMINEMKRLGKPVFVHLVESKDEPVPV